MAKLTGRGIKTPNKKTLVIAGVVFLSLILFAALVPVRQKSANDIFVLTPTETLEYGYTTLTGTIRKDSPAGENGFYFLVLLVESIK
jgi:hypothetical protein